MYVVTSVLPLFKFHCDSINICCLKLLLNLPLYLNSTVILLICPILMLISVEGTNLNSTVILLIFFHFAFPLPEGFNLNSTVILLIYGKPRFQTNRYLFKFHCDSINIATTSSPASPPPIFKFHCDSINIIQIIVSY